MSQSVRPWRLMFTMDLLICFVISGVRRFLDVDTWRYRPRVRILLGRMSVYLRRRSWSPCLLSLWLFCLVSIRTKALHSSLVRFWNIFRFSLVSVSARRVLSMYSSRAVLFVLGGSQLDRLLNSVLRMRGRFFVR